MCTFIYLDLPPALQVDEMKTARPAKPAVVAHQSNLIGHSRATQISAAADNNIAGLLQAGRVGSGGHVPTQFLADQLTLSQPEGAVLTVHPVEIETASEKMLNLDGIVLLELCWFALDWETVALELYLGFLEFLLELKIPELDWI